jgi:Raf kinase inhibitor-like YbhB/YbcL family protein
MRIESRAFQDGGRIPERYTGDGEGLSPPLAISGLPEGTRSIAVVVDDPDAPRGTWVHWLVWGIPADQGSIPEGVPTEPIVPELGGARQGKNDFGELGYGGPAPPRGHGAHHYRFTAHALGEHIDLDAGATRDALEERLKEATLATARVTGTYSRT